MTKGSFFGIIFEEALVLAVFGFVLVFVGTLVACTLSGAIATGRLAQADPADLL